MFPIESFKNTLLKFTSLLQNHEIQFHLTGGITGVAYGEPRLTQVIDLVIENAAFEKKLDLIGDELERADFIFSRPAIIEALRNKRMFQLFDAAESLKLDVYPRELIEGELSRSEWVEVFENVSLPIASRSDAAISKLIWIQKGSHKSRRDFRQIFSRANIQDQKLIEYLAVCLDLESLLAEVLAESDEIND